MASTLLTAACSEGATVAAESGGTLAAGRARTRQLARQGPGSVQHLRVQASQPGQVVIVAAQGRAPQVFPWPGGFPVQAQVTVPKERLYG